MRAMGGRGDENAPTPGPCVTRALRSVAACALAVAAAVVMARPASAQQIKPYILVVFDTSGSMSDAATDDTCGYAGATKMTAAKCALTRILNATGDVEWGLMQYAQNSCSNNTATCNTTSASAWLRVPVETNSSGLILPLVDAVTSNAPTDELCAQGPTPLGGTLAAAREYFQGATSPTIGDTALGCRPLGVILLTDGEECCGGCSNAWSGCPKSAAAPPAGVGITCQTACSGCYFESAPDRAFELSRETKVPTTGTDVCPAGAGCVPVAIPTYPIGFGITAPNTRMENIAIAGGTDAPGANRAFYASNEAALSLALTQIIADAQPPPEICNNVDDDCDILIDEGITKYCDRPHGIMDLELCVEPPESECDGKDDDCDGLVDEGLLNACGVCMSPDEMCDGLDNDCDSRVDESIDKLGPCGTDVGICEKGDLLCIAGEPVCKGGRGPEPEACDCEDNDCDGLVDEAGDDPLCPGDQVCLGCECVDPCGMTPEFAASCPPGLRVEFQESGLCLCIEDTCDPKECTASTIQHADGPACAPNDEALGTCVCKAGNCVARCDGVTCGSGEICDKHNGRCVQNNCRGLGCPEEGQLCDPLDGKCVEDACADKCAANQVCREGLCEISCVVAACVADRKCVRGQCLVDRCAGVMCSGGQFCDPTLGRCVKNPCTTVSCASGLECDPTTGECGHDACWQVRCPEGQACKAGECAVAVDARDSGRRLTEADRERLLATGAGGCTCRAAGGGAGDARDGRGVPVLAWLACAGVALWRGRRRSMRGNRRGRVGFALAAFVALLVGLALGLGGCKVQPYCLNCIDGAVVINGEVVIPDGSTVTGTGGGGADAGGTGVIVGPDGGLIPVADGGVLPTGCTRGAKEKCDGHDDDCDFKVDEDAVITKNDCETHGVCAGTQPVCLGGKSACRYPPEWEMDETVCDGADNDCDGRIDEAFAMLGDPCSVGSGACVKEGRLGCNASGTGLECDAKAGAPKKEVCDGIDNDCDGMVDEPKSDPGPAPSYVVDKWVQVGASLWVYAYEASRADATDSEQGIITTRACSRAGVLPWTNLDRDEAIAACAGADVALCTESQWVAACEAGAGCGWAFTPASGTCDDYIAQGSDDCNGHDVSAPPGGADNDALAPTGSFATCYADHPDGKIFDLSGNAKEWTTGTNSPAENPLRGGSYNNSPGGLRCDFDFTLAPADLRVANVGFRCCTTTAP